MLGRRGSDLALGARAADLAFALTLGAARFAGAFFAAALAAGFSAGCLGFLPGFFSEWACLWQLHALLCPNLVELSPQRVAKSHRELHLLVLLALGWLPEKSAWE